MGAVPWAAGDPVVWVHHCMIDRLWASWNAGGRANPTNATFPNQTFTFADPRGNRVLARIGDFLDISRLGYSCARLELVPPCPPVRRGALALTISPISQASSLTLGTAPARATFNLGLARPPGGGPAPLKPSLPAWRRWIPNAGCFWCCAS